MWAACKHGRNMFWREAPKGSDSNRLVLRLRKQKRSREQFSWSVLSPDQLITYLVILDNKGFLMIWHSLSQKVAFLTYFSRFSPSIFSFILTTVYRKTTIFNQTTTQECFHHVCFLQTTKKEFQPFPARWGMSSSCRCTSKDRKQV